MRVVQRKEAAHEKLMSKHYTVTLILPAVHTALAQLRLHVE